MEPAAPEGGMESAPSPRPTSSTAKRPGRGMDHEEIDRIFDSMDDYLARLRSHPLAQAFKKFEESRRPKYYHRDGTPIVSNELMPALEQWAVFFEGNRTVKQTMTPYGERLSTVFLGLDHNFFPSGPPQIFETMLFAPDAMKRQAVAYYRGNLDPYEKRKYEENKARIEREYPDNQLQFRYATEDEARDDHETLMLQCLIPPRWRHFLLWTVGRDERWKRYDDEEDEWD